MNEKLQYATMLEIPVSTCNVTFRQKKKSKGKKNRRVDSEVVKQELLDKINSDEIQSQATGQCEYAEQDGVQIQERTQEIDGELTQTADNGLAETTAVVHIGKVKRKKERSKLKVSIIGVQLAIIGVLVATIFLTNALYAGSGINVFLRGVFGVEQSKVDDRIFNDFSPVLSVGDGEVVLEEGVMTFSGEGSVYSPCNGKITSVVQDVDGKFTIEITHSSNFKSVLSGVDYAYVGLEDMVYNTIPVGYVTAGATMCFKSGDGSVISNYQIVDYAVIWAV